MGLIPQIFGFLFGSGRNVVVETAQVFRENAEAAAVRAAEGQSAALGQMAAEFAQPRRGLFDGLIDGLNRLPRPIMAFGVLGLMGSAMWNPVWFAERMVGISLVPEPLWWLMGAIVSFYFGARAQAQGQAFQHSIAQTLARVPQAQEALAALEDLRPRPPQPTSPAAADTRSDADAARAATDLADPNPALSDWNRTQA